MDKKGIALLVLLLIPALWLRIQDISEPFDNGLRGSAAGGYTLMAENHLRYGFLITGFVPVMNTRPVSRDCFVYYQHHPPGMVALTAMAFALLGRSDEAAARILPILFSMLGLLVLFTWVRSVSGDRVAFATAAMAAVVPLSTYYGVFLNFETFVIPPTLMAVYAHMQWMRTGRMVFLRRALLFMVIGALLDWVALIAGGLMMLDGFLFGPRASEMENRTDGGKVKLWLLLYPLLAVVTFFAVKAWYFFQNSRFGSPSEIASDFLAYVIKASILGSTFQMSLFLEKISTYLVDLVTWPILICALPGLFQVLYRLLLKGPRGLEERSILILLLWGLINLFLFAVHATVHEYWILLLYPGILWCAGLTLGLLGMGLQRLSLHPRWALMILPVLVFSGITDTLSVRKDRRGQNELHSRGLFYKELAGENSMVFTPEGEPAQVIYYSGGALYPYPIQTPEILGHHLHQLKKYGYLNLSRIYAVSPNLADHHKSSIDRFKEIAKEEEWRGFTIFRL